MKIYIGADHRGYAVKKKIIAVVEKLGIPLEDVGSFDPEKNCDYPLIARKVAQAVAESRNRRGILVCMSGIGHAIAANKVRGAYAALCYNVEAAELSRRHNNANILVLGSKFIVPKEIPKIVQRWLNTPFEGGRHQNRVQKIANYEKENSCGGSK